MLKKMLTFCCCYFWSKGFPRNFKCLSDKVPSDFLSDQGPECSPSALNGAVQMLSDVNKILSVKRQFMYTNKHKNYEEDFEEIIWKQNQSIDLKSF